MAQEMPVLISDELPTSTTWVLLFALIYASAFRPVHVHLLFFSSQPEQFFRL